MIVSGRKTVELRTWPTNHRGELALCAGLQVDLRGESFGFDGPRGVVLAVATLVSCARVGDEVEQAACFKPSNYAPRVYGWTLADVRPVASPPKVRGQRGLFTLPEELLPLLRA